MIGASFEETTLCGRLMFHLFAALANSGVIWSESGPVPAQRNVVGAAAAAADKLPGPMASGGWPQSARGHRTLRGS